MSCQKGCLNLEAQWEHSPLAALFYRQLLLPLGGPIHPECLVGKDMLSGRHGTVLWDCCLEGKVSYNLFTVIIFWGYFKRLKVKQRYTKAEKYC